MGKSTNQRIRLWEAGQHDCYYCQRRLLKPHPEQPHPTSPLSATLDHVVPKSRGGKRGNNLVLVCRDCNELKGDLSDYEFDQATTLFDLYGYKLEKPGGHYKALKNHQVWPLVAQRIEHPSPTREVAGSTPAERAKGLCGWFDSPATKTDWLATAAVQVAALIVLVLIFD